MLVPRRSEGIRRSARSNSISDLFAFLGCVWNKAKDAPATAPPVMMAWEIAADSLMPEGKCPVVRPRQREVPGMEANQSSCKDSLKFKTELNRGTKSAPPPTPAAVDSAPTCEAHTS